MGLALHVLLRPAQHFFGLVMFRYLEETPVWQQLQQARKTKGPAVVVVSPLKRLFGREYRGVMLVNLLITFGGGATYYLACGYLPTLLNVVANVPHTQTSQLLMYGSVATIVGALAFGYLSDLIGRKKTFMLLGVINLVGLPMLFLGVAEPGSLSRTALYCVGIAFMGGAIIAPILIFLNERFTTEPAPAAPGCPGTSVSPLAEPCRPLCPCSAAAQRRSPWYWRCSPPACR